MSKASSIQEIFENINEGFDPDKSEGVDAIFQFDLTGDDGGKYWIKVVDKTAEVNEGEHDDPTMTIIAAAEDYLAMVNGDLNAMMAFGQGKIKVDGNPMLATKLQSLFG